VAGKLGHKPFGIRLGLVRIDIKLLANTEPDNFPQRRLTIGSLKNNS